VLYFLLLFASNMFYPLAPLPGWLKAIAWVNPVTWQVDVFRYATLDLAEGDVLLQSALFCALTLVSFAGAVYVLRHHE